MTKAEALAQVGEEILTKDICPHLREGAIQLVLGDGNPEAQVVFIGEAPGAKEDQLGLPFVGASGRLLDTMLESIGLERADVYITNIVKYRPPANRDPNREEIAAFLPFLMQQIEIINPKLIVTLGRHAMNVFLPELTISQAHGQPVMKDGRLYLPLFHPAAALYNGSMRQTLMDDFEQIRTILNK